MKLVVERQSVILWEDVKLHLNDTAEIIFSRLKKQGVKLTMTAASYIIISKDGKNFWYTLSFEDRDPKSHLIRIEKDYGGYSWSKPKSLKVWEKIYE